MFPDLYRVKPVLTPISLTRPNVDSLSNSALLILTWTARGCPFPRPFTTKGISSLSSAWRFDDYPWRPSPEDHSFKLLQSNSAGSVRSTSAVSYCPSKASISCKISYPFLLPLGIGSRHTRKTTMRMLRGFKALSFQFAHKFLSCTMFQPTTKARNYRLLYVISIIFHLSIN